MMEEKSKAKRKKPRKPLYDDKEFTVPGNGERVQSLLKSTPRQASHYRANASTAKNTVEQPLIYGSGLSVALKTHDESALICESGLETSFQKSSAIPMVVPACI